MTGGLRSGRGMVRASAPGRVNLMGDHTDHTGGLVLPMACGLHTTVVGERGGDRVVLTSELDGRTTTADVPRSGEVADAADTWTRLVGAAVRATRPATGLRGTVATDLPVGAGLSSSASVCTALVLALGVPRPPVELAVAAREVEIAATGVPCGLMDQLAVAAGRDGHALRIDCTDVSLAPVPVPDDLDVLVVDSTERRSLAGSPYGHLVEALQLAQREVGPLRQVTLHDLTALRDPDQQRFARHVVTENARVDQVAAALRAGDRAALADAFAASHDSLRRRLGTTTPAIDALVEDLVRRPTVVGARCTGAGFGGCVVALAEAGTPLPSDRPGWRFRPAAGATCSAAP